MRAIDWTSVPGNSTPAHRLVLASVMSAAALGAAASISLIAPLAHALTEQEVQQICAAKGGTYTTTGPDENGHTYSTCCYYDLYGQHCDQYQDGDYLGTYGRGTGTTGAPVPRPGPVGPRPGPLPAHP